MPPSLARAHVCPLSRALSYCDAGYFCPPNSTTPQTHVCGGVDRYCPRGSGRPTFVNLGYYTAGNEEDLANLTRTRQVLCEAGSFCVVGVRQLCPAGVFGNVSGLTGTRLLDVPIRSTLLPLTPERDEAELYAKQNGYGSARTTEGGFNRDGIVHHASSSMCSGWCPAGAS